MADNRRIVEQTVKKNTGITFTELKQETGLSNGVLQYHLRNSSRIVQRRGALLHRDQCGECGLQDICRARCIHSVLRNDTKRRIVEMLEEGKNQNEIAERLDLDKSTVSYHVQYLKDAGVLTPERTTPGPIELDG